MHVMLRFMGVTNMKEKVFVRLLAVILLVTGWYNVEVHQDTYGKLIFAVCVILLIGIWVYISFVEKKN